MSVLDEQRLVRENQVTADQVTTTAGDVVDVDFTDQAALKIVLDDFDTARGKVERDQWLMQWEESRILYQSPRGLGVFEGSGVTRANVSNFTVAEQVNSLAPSIASAIFGNASPFEIRPRGRTTQQAAFAWKALLEMLLDEIDFELTVKNGLEIMVNQGTVVFTGGWETKTRIVKTMVRTAEPPEIKTPMGPPLLIHTKESDEFKVVEKEETISRPYFDIVPLGTIFPDPKWDKPNQLHKANYVVRELYLTYADLKDLAAGNADYDLPSEEELRKIFIGPDHEQGGGQTDLANRDTSGLVGATGEDQTTSADPLEGTLQVLERWTADRCMTVLQGKIVIRNARHNLPGIPFWSSNFWNMEGTGWGLGVGRIAGANQRVSQGTINAALDIIAFAVNPEYVVTNGVEGITGDMRRRLGGVRKVNSQDARHAFALVEQPVVPADVWRMLQVANDTGRASTGADQAAVMGSLPGRGSSIGHSSAGAGIISSASSTRIQAPVDRALDGVILQFIPFVFECCQEYMPGSELRLMLGDLMAAALQPDLTSMYNARLKFDSLAGTRLKARAAMAQALPFLLQVLENQALISQLNQTGYKIDAQMVVSMVMDVSEWKDQAQLVVPMTAQEQQLMQQAQQAAAAAQMQGKETLLAQKQQGDQTLEDMKLQGRLAALATKEGLQRHLEPPDDSQNTGQGPGDAGHSVSVLERAASLAERDQVQHQMQGSAYFGGGQ